MKKLGLLCFFCLCQTMVFGQNKLLLDSLQKVYHTAKHDTIKIMALTSIAFEYRSSKPDTCITIAEKALAESEKIDFEKGRGWALDRLGAGYMSKRKYDDALAWYQQALAIFEKTQDRKGIAANLNSVGNIYYYQANYPQALSYYQRSLDTSQQIGDKQGMAISLGNIGVIYNYQENYPLALEYYQRSLAIKEKIGDKQGISSSFYNIGLIYYYQANYPLALEYYQRSLEIREKIGNKQGISSCLINIGVIHLEQDNDSLALEYYQKSLKIKEEVGDKEGVALSLDNIGIIYSKQGKNSLALEYYQKSLKISEEIGYKVGVSTTLKNIGISYSKQGNYPLAVEYYQKSLKISEAIGNKFGISYALHGLAQVYQKQQDYAQSIAYVQRSLSIAQELQAPLEIKAASQILYESYKLKGDYTKALEYHELYKATNDSIFNVDKAKAIGNLEAKAEVERKEKEITLLNKDKELDKKAKEALAKDLELQRIEAERQKNAKLIVEKQAEANRLFALARQEKDKRKQDSLQNVAQKIQLETDNLKAKEKQLEAEQSQKDIAQEKQRQQFYWIIFSAFAGLVFSVVILFLVFRSRKKIQNAYSELAISNAKVQQAKEEIETQAEELQKLNHFKDRLFSIIAHDLRSPMATLQGTISILDPDILDKDELATVKSELTKQFEVTDKILQDLLQWTKDQMKGETIEAKLLNFNEIVNEKLNLFTAIAQTKNINLLSEVMPNTPIFADENHVNIILQNLLSNALKFTYSGGTITIKSQKIDKMIQISVADTGKGMNEEEQSKLFTNQYFTTKGTTGEKGNGLGLNLVKSLVEKNGGKIWVKSEEGKGTEFCFLLPMNLLM